MKWKVSKSNVHGNGIFSKIRINKGEYIGLALPLVLETSTQKIFERNTLGLLINNSPNPNCECINNKEGWGFIALEDIESEKELFVNYKDYEKKIDTESFKSGKRISVI